MIIIIITRKYKNLVVASRYLNCVHNDTYFPLSEHNFSFKTKGSGVPFSPLYLLGIAVVCNYQLQTQGVFSINARCRQRWYFWSIFVDIKNIRGKHALSHSLFTLICGYRKEGILLSWSINIGIARSPGCKVAETRCPVIEFVKLYKCN